jgi:hypothetical protein
MRREKENYVNGRASYLDEVNSIEIAGKKLPRGGVITIPNGKTCDLFYAFAASQINMRLLTQAKSSVQAFLFMRIFKGIAELHRNTLLGFAFEEAVMSSNILVDGFLGE